MLPRIVQGQTGSLNGPWRPGRKEFLLVNFEQMISTGEIKLNMNMNEFYFLNWIFFKEHIVDLVRESIQKRIKLES